jgi:hypothetical protein
MLVFVIHKKKPARRHSQRRRADMANLKRSAKERFNFTMMTKALTPEIKASYVVAVFAYAFAFYIAAKIEGPFGVCAALFLAVASLWLVTASTFCWGKLVGYSVFDQERKFSLEHFLRNLVMTGLVIVLLSIIGSPVFGFVFWLIAKK